jgi:phage terminase large subunit-like protein
MDTESAREPGGYYAAALEYADAVRSGRIDACRYVRLACERQLADELAEERGEFPYHFDVARAEEICRFIEQLPHIKGRWASANLRLEPWQCFILTTVFGWLDSYGNRRFRAVYIEVPRKNGKSALTAGVGLYMLAADGELGAECYSLATKREQALAVWLVARFMAMRQKSLCKHYGIEVRARSIMAEGGAGFFQALSSDENGLDGLNPHFAGIDELHAHRTRVVHDVMDSATGARSQPLLWEITTAGSDASGVCFETRDYAIKVLENVQPDPQTFGIIYTLDKDDLDAKDWFNERLWKKANPNYGVSVSPIDFQRKARKAKATPAALSEFLRKGLDVWTQVDSPWMDMAAWNACADPALTLEQFAGQRCWIGEDLASKIDVAAKVRIFDVDEVLYCITGKDSFFLPETAVRESRNASYQGWVEAEYLKTTPGNIIDFDYIEESLREDAARFEVTGVGYDPHQATQHATRMMGEGFPMVEVRQTVLSLSEPMKEFEARVLSGRFKHDGNPVLTWMVSNVVCHLDAKDNIYPRKQKPEKKIDGAVAIIMALALMLKETQGYAEGRLVLA